MRFLAASALLVTIAVVIAVTFARNGPAADASVTWPAHGPLRVLFVGDSLTVGDFAIDPGNQFATQVTQYLAARGSIVATKDAQGGVRVGYWSSRKMPSRQRLAIVELGTNDLFAWPAPSPSVLATFDSQYRALVAHIAAASPGVRIVCLSVWHPYGHTADTQPYDVRIRQDCRGRYVDISDLGTQANLASDGFHPNDAAHRQIAQRIEAAIHVARS
jgi:lysophospholipase L1-like esterase